MIVINNLSLEAYKPLKDKDAIIVEINRIFHKFDAQTYDKQHPEIFETLPPIYRDMCNFLPKQKALNVLNFGCGTGFEAGQLLSNVSNIDTLYCYDISTEMLQKCRQKYPPPITDGCSIKYISDLSEIPADIKFDVLVTNSLLHHLPEPFETIDDLTKYMADDCHYIMGHEPSARFFKNTEVAKKVAELRKERFASKNLNRLLSFRNYPLYMKAILFPKTDSYRQTALESVKAGLFGVTPPRAVIGRIIDCNVPHNLESALNGIGFDFLNIPLNNEWDLLYSKTYNFTKNNAPYSKLIYKEQRLYDELFTQYPNDGLNFCCLWRKREDEK